jgi:hypothetical protein
VNDFNVELEERLREVSSAFKEAVEPPATLHASVMTRTTIRATRRRPMLAREMALAAALVVFVALVAFGFSKLRTITPAPVKRSPSPSPVSAVIPWVSTTPTPLKLQAPKILTSDQAAQDIRRSVTDVHPVLLPSAIPTGFQVQLYDDSGGFSAVYGSADGRKITFSIVVPNPALGSGNGRFSQPTFRSVRADYMIGDTAQAASPRWLMWNEPGTPLGGQPGVPYFLTTDGFTESQFWQIANSIGPIAVPPQPPTCKLADLDLVSNGSNGATGHIAYSISLSNHGPVACSLTGYPDISLVTRQGTRLTLPEQKVVGGFLGSPDVAQVVLPPNQVAPAPHSGTATAYVIFEWYYCGATPPAIGAVDLKLPGSAASRRVPILDEGLASGPSRCDDPSQGRTLLVGAIVAPAADAAVFQAPALRVSLDLQETMVAGKTIRYHVTIANESGAPITFDTCPAYDEGFTPDGMVSYELNCAPVRRLEAGSSATFAMEFAVPPASKTPAGPEKFLWRLHGFDGFTSAGKVVMVTAP